MVHCTFASYMYLVLLTDRNNMENYLTVLTCYLYQQKLNKRPGTNNFQLPMEAPQFRKPHMYALRTYFCYCPVVDRSPRGGE